MAYFALWLYMVAIVWYLFKCPIWFALINALMVEYKGKERTYFNGILRGILAHLISLWYTYMVCIDKCAYMRFLRFVNN